MLSFSRNCFICDTDENKLHLKIQVVIFCVVTPCSVVVGYQRFGYLVAPIRVNGIPQEVLSEVKLKGNVVPVLKYHAIICQLPN
jgi:hypothetical protein